MAKLILSAFADEYSSNFIEQLKALNGFGINYIEVRGVDGKNVSTLTASEVKDAKLKLNDYGIKVSSIGSPLGKIK
ncbi:MAG: sugar phosphate isomerase/epimerase, partial [Clostridia bacterium]|nr:sugar phosphate isomerase/epimerase [Clostridia bacterium]